MILKWTRLRAGHYCAGRYHVRQLQGYKAPWKLCTVDDYGAEFSVTGRSYETARDAKDGAEDYEAALQAAEALGKALDTVAR